MSLKRFFFFFLLKSSCREVTTEVHFLVSTMRCCCKWFSRFIREGYGEVVPVSESIDKRLKAKNVYKVVMSREISSAVVSTHCVSLAEYVREGLFGPAEECRILGRMIDGSVRHEEVLCSCLWRILKAPHSASSCEREPTGAFLEQKHNPRDLASYTSFAFRVMAEAGVVNDPQLVTLSLGRCIELVEWFSAYEVGEAYRALYALQRQHFTVAEVACSGPQGPFRSNEIHPLAIIEEAVPNARELIFQPNLIDILSSSLEERIQRLVVTSCEVKSIEREPSTLFVDSAVSFPYERCSSSAVRSVDVLHILRGMSFLGIQKGETFVHLGKLCVLPHRATIQYYVNVLRLTMGIDARTVDLLHHEERRGEIVKSKENFIRIIVDELMKVQNIKGVLHKDHQLVLDLRNLFESFTELWECAPTLWDAVRSVSISHQKALKLARNRVDTFNIDNSPNGSAGSVIRRGKLFNPRFKVKPPRMSDGECSIPPQFKVVKPAHSERCRRGSNSGAVKFGVRRVTKGYIKSKRKKYCPSVKL